MSKQPHLLIEPGQIAKYIVVCGEPNRVNRIAEQLLTDWQVIAENREYRLINGFFKQTPITLCSTGIGAPSLLIALEELRQCGAQYIIRVGSAGALQPDQQLNYLIGQYLHQQQAKYHSGIIRSHDSFYTDAEQQICQYWHKKGVLGADMETSALLTVGRLRQLKTASILNNVVLYQQDVTEGVTAYVDEADTMMQGEHLAAKTALSVFHLIEQ